MRAEYPGSTAAEPENSSKPQIAAKDRKCSQMAQALGHRPMVFTGHLPGDRGFGDEATEMNRLILGIGRQLPIPG
jgi:hypothetical protein